MRISTSFAIPGLALVSIGVFACGVEPYSGAALALWPDIYEDAGPLPVEAATPADAGPGSCRQAHGQSLPQRLVTMSALAKHTGSTLGADDLFAYFDASVCGQACHGTASAPPGLGNWRIGSATELTKIDETVLRNHVESEGPSDIAHPNDVTDPDDPMPPYGNALYMPYSQRLPADPVRAFVAIFQAWIDAGQPMADFTPPVGVLSTTEGDHYVNTPDVGTEMTNIGNCVPDATRVAQSRSPSNPNLPAMTALDNTFANGDITPDSDAGAASQIGLPDDIFGTDLTTFDSSDLAAQGVIAFQPTYPNWFDDAKAIRYVRVPVGQSIRFDKANQSFAIPDNTRFYETILKRIADVDGSYRWRKMETRILVARNSSTPLVGTYLWNDTESDAPLWVGPLAARNDGQPFKANTLFYTADEELAQAITATTPADENLDLALVASRASRHYAVPSRDQCGACHMGSPTKNYVLGFTPLQLNRRPKDAGGVRDTPGADEMTQLQRFIDYGLITGMASPADVVPLERTEGSRTPRNDYELAAQAYMVGNCAHCHNPNGAATKNNPELLGVLDFMPSADGGIFQFPLTKTSPRILRGIAADIPIPYITPSLMDLPETNKFFGNSTILLAPWRSLVFRAVETPFPYTDDNALFPHMPMNGAGFDRTAKQIMSDWMVSIPAVRTNVADPEYPNTQAEVLDGTPQPYVEVAPGVPGYDDAVQAAQERLSILHTGNNPATEGYFSAIFSEYAYCPDTSDILDPAVQANPDCQIVPPPPKTLIQGNTVIGLPGTYWIPERADWIPVDTTVATTNWSPVRPDWAQVLIDQDLGPLSTACGTQHLLDEETAQREDMIAVGLLQSAGLAQVHDYATTEIPMGLWTVKKDCDLSGQKTVGQVLSGGATANWLTNNPKAPALTPDAPVVVESPGAYLYNQICSNCHGSNADGHGRLATNLALMTGGHGIPSNFIAGLFGPVAAPGINVKTAFLLENPEAWADAGSDDRAARYTAWMGLGGTALTIPQSVVQIVGTTSVFGSVRTFDPSLISGNMLSVAKALCMSLLFGDTTPSAANVAGYAPLEVDNPWFTTDKTGQHLQAASNLFTSNGDAELWLKLCTLDNPPPVRAIFSTLGEVGNAIGVEAVGSWLFSTDLFDPDANGNLGLYAGQQLGNDRGDVEAEPGFSATNLRPWCYRRGGTGGTPRTPQCPSTIDDGRSAPRPVGGDNLGVGMVMPDDAGALLLPSCRGNDGASTDYHCWGPVEADQWATRGAINAGMAVYLYLQELANGSVTPLPPYDKCEALTPAQ
jgi:mono/diheme cytochrome c family protein